MLRAMSVAAGVAAGFLWNTHRATHRPLLRVVSHEAPDGDATRSLRILHLSDLHMERLSVGVEQLMSMVRNTDPDLVALTGDYLDKASSLDKLSAYLRRIRDIRAPLGFFAVLGNHDHYLGARTRELRLLLAECGFTVLNNGSTRIDADGKKFDVVGVDDYSTGYSNFREAYAGSKGEVPVLLLSHDPNGVLVMRPEHRADYVLSGHLHGGQVNVPGAFRLFPMGELPRQRIIKGLHRVNGRWLYISEGLGQSGLNVRFRSRPEVTLHLLQGFGRTRATGVGRPEV